jgi:hypothetical protein
MQEQTYILSWDDGNVYMAVKAKSLEAAYNKAVDYGAETEIGIIELTQDIMFIPGKPITFPVRGEATKLKHHGKKVECAICTHKFTYSATDSKTHNCPNCGYEYND